MSSDTLIKASRIVFAWSRLRLTYKSEMKKQSQVNNCNYKLTFQKKYFHAFIKGGSSLKIREELRNTDNKSDLDMQHTYGLTTKSNGSRRKVKAFDHQTEKRKFVSSNSQQTIRCYGTHKNPLRVCPLLNTGERSRGNKYSEKWKRILIRKQDCLTLSERSGWTTDTVQQA